jgi:hypothetical protein
VDDVVVPPQAAIVPMTVAARKVARSVRVDTRLELHAIGDGATEIG